MNKRNIVAFIFSFIILVVGMIFTINDANPNLTYSKNKISLEN